MADIIGGLVTSQMNWMNNQEAFRQQKELQRNAQDFNKMMFNAANMYNSPLQQMMRFKSAGLNPNLIYGQMANTASAPTMGSPSAPSAAQAAPLNLLETAQIDLIKAQKDNIKADTDEKLAGANLKNTNSDLMKAQKAHLQDVLGPYYDEMRKVAHQEGVHQAIQNWLDGYVPVAYDKDGNWTGNMDDYPEEYTKMGKLFEDAKQAIADEYHMTHKERERLDTLFQAMVDNDLEQLNASLANLKANNAILQKYADKEWFQAIYFIVNTLGKALQGVAPIALGISNARTGRMNAHSNRMNASKPARQVNIFPDHPF